MKRLAKIKYKQSSRELPTKSKLFSVPPGRSFEKLVNIDLEVLYGTTDDDDRNF